MNLIIGAPEIDRFRENVARRFGLNLENGLSDRIADALERAVHRTGDADASCYVRRFESGACSPSELAALVEDLTVAETYFFRHPDQFRAALERAVLERLRGQVRGRLRMLSAGCASGEEAYSLAILIRDNVPEDAGMNASVLGIDLNANLLEKARRARYTAWSLRGVPEDVRQRHFQSSGRDFLLSEPVRKLVTFAPCNLLEEVGGVWQSGAFDVIFCRNVVMYFTPEAVRAVIARLARALVPGGFLFLGPAETLRGVSHDFHLQHSHETFYYQRRSTDEPAPRRPLEANPAIQITERDLPVAAAIDESWVATICRASERVASLSRQARATHSFGGSSNGKSGTASTPPRFETSDAATSNCLGAARQLVLEERFDEALRLLEALPGDEARNPDVQLLCAAVLTNGGRVREADHLCRTVLANDELNAEAHYLLALCREHAGDVAAAMEQDQLAIYLDPQFAMPHLHLGLLAKRAGDRGTARDAFRKATLLLSQEDASRIVLFGGGFGRAALAQLCQSEVRSAGGPL